jgi:hypothetical protein
LNLQAATNSRTAKVVAICDPVRMLPSSVLDAMRLIAIAQIRRGCER